MADGRKSESESKGAGSLKWPLKAEESSSLETKSEPKKPKPEESPEEERVHIFGRSKKTE